MVLFCDVRLGSLPWDEQTWREKAVYFAHVAAGEARRLRLNEGEPAFEILIKMASVKWAEIQNPSLTLAQFQHEFQKFEVLQRLVWPFAESGRAVAAQEQQVVVGDQQPQLEQQHADPQDPALQRPDAHVAALAAEEAGGDAREMAFNPPRSSKSLFSSSFSSTMDGWPAASDDSVDVSHARMQNYLARTVGATQGVLPEGLAKIVKEMFTALIGPDPCKPADKEALERARALIVTHEVRDLCTVPDVTPLPEHSKAHTQLLAQQLAWRNVFYAHLVVKR